MFSQTENYLTVENIIECNIASEISLASIFPQTSQVWVYNAPHNHTKFTKLQDVTSNFKNIEFAFSSDFFKQLGFRQFNSASLLNDDGQILWRIGRVWKFKFETLV